MSRFFVGRIPRRTCSAMPPEFVPPPCFPMRPRRTFRNRLTSLPEFFIGRASGLDESQPKRLMMSVADIRPRSFIQARVENKSARSDRIADKKNGAIRLGIAPPKLTFVTCYFTAAANASPAGLSAEPLYNVPSVSDSWPFVCHAHQIPTMCPFCTALIQAVAKTDCSLLVICESGPQELSVSNTGLPPATDWTA